MQIDISDQTGELTDKQVNLLIEVLSFSAKQEKIHHEVELSVSIVTNGVIQEMNHLYRSKNEPTDVLSFQMDHVRDVDPDSHLPLMMGDIIISIEKVHEQKDRYNHSFERELIFLAIHGFLHLLGYTHDNKENEAVMFGKQDAILEAYRLER
ncbi:MAG TPA: rRNA maturation RNase YbeY [Pseudogracilibacillus sp.]|nr:rRNA maturation RNase YbeY [Pseudogracilibacillus sp.]